MTPSRTAVRTNRARLALRKVAWGSGQVGFATVAAGTARLAWLRARRPNTVRVTSHRHGLAVTFRYPSQLIPTLVVFGDLLEPELGLLPGRLGQGDVAVDVGASIGTWSMVAARTGAAVHACEPDPDNLAVLGHNLAANGLGSAVTVHPVAVGRHAGQVTVQRHSRRYLNQVVAVGEGPSSQERPTPMVTLLSLVDQLGVREIAVLKVNTAGHEADVLAGALPLLIKGRVRVALFLDGTRVREALEDAFTRGALAAYALAIFDGDQARLVDVPTIAALEGPRPSPMNHYVILHRRDSRPLADN